ncbi:MAG: DNA-processing protein DprA [Candidatus Daviesbacteria bacterium]|nr:DNA-processing protein DprA [Candidatus Daviesbacteria bacterium]
MENVEYLLALHSVNGLGPVRLKILLQYFQDPKLAWNANYKEIINLGIPKNVAELLIETRKKLIPEKYIESIKKSGISWITLFDENYPKLLKEIYDPPVILFYKGEILESDKKAIAVVGTRKMTSYGKLVTEKLTKELIGFGVTIVSGLARGVDTEAHKCAISANGRTLAVLGGGLNHVFPPENIELAKKISSGFGAIISEFPPDHPSLPGNFPARNRIISGLSRGVLVTEAAEDSGSLITARLALEQGRDVFAVPGPITSDLSKGPSSLIKAGARLVTSASEILEELGWEVSQMSKMSQISQMSTLTDNEKRILESLENESKHIDDLCRELNLSASQVSASLIKMEITSLIKNLGGGNFLKIC